MRRLLSSLLILVFLAPSGYALDIVGGGGSGGGGSGTVTTTGSMTTGKLTKISSATSITEVAGTEAYQIGVLPRVTPLTDAATVTPNLDTTDVGTLATLSQATNFANATGTPANGQRFTLRITSSTPRAVTWGTLYSAETGVALPSTTTGGGTVDVWAFLYNSTSSKLDFVGTTSSTAPLAIAGGGTGVAALPGSSGDCLTNNAGALGSANCGTGTTSQKLWLPAASCQNTTATLLWDTPTTNPAVAACITGTNTQKGVADFADSASLSMQQTLLLPSDWTGAVDAKFKWLTTATSGDVVWQIATICVADAETDDPAFNTASTVTDTAKGTTNQTNDASITTVTVTGCAAGELMHIKVSRDSAHASDTLAATARLIGVELTTRRAQ